MLRARCSYHIVSIEVLRRQYTDPKRGVGQFAIEPRKILVGDEARAVDNYLAGIEFGLQDVGKRFKRRKLALLLGAYVKSN
jgi:hypothetical protein